MRRCLGLLETKPSTDLENQLTLNCQKIQRIYKGIKG